MVSGKRMLLLLFWNTLALRTQASQKTQTNENTDS